MRARTNLPPIRPARPSPRMTPRENLDPSHRHPAPDLRNSVAAEFTGYNNGRLSLALSLIANQQQAAASRALLAALLTLGNLLLAGLTTWLFLQASSFYPQAPLMRLVVVLLCLAGLALVFLSLVSGLRAILYWWTQNSPAATPTATLFGGAETGPAAVGPDQVREIFLGSTRQELLDAAADAMSQGVVKARAQAAYLRYAVIFLLLAVGAFLFLVFLAGFGLI